MLEQLNIVSFESLVSFQDSHISVLSHIQHSFPHCGLTWISESEIPSWTSTVCSYSFNFSLISPGTTDSLSSLCVSGLLPSFYNLFIFSGSWTVLPNTICRVWPLINSWVSGSDYVLAQLQSYLCPFISVVTKHWYHWRLTLLIWSVYCSQCSSSFGVCHTFWTDIAIVWPFSHLPWHN